MKLADLRKVTVKKHLRIRFPLSNGMECVINEHGVAQVPALRGVPSFNLEEELAGTNGFVVETPASTSKERLQSPERKYSREEMMALAAAGGSAEVAHDDHEE